jgi:lysophospholipase L1-like esterase
MNVKSWCNNLMLNDDGRSAMSAVPAGEACRWRFGKVDLRQMCIHKIRENPDFINAPYFLVLAFHPHPSYLLYNRVSRVQPVPENQPMRILLSAIPRALCTLTLVILYAVPLHGLSAGVDASVMRWVGTWSTSPQLVETGNNPPAPGLANNTLRQVLRISIGGDSLRVRFSNEFSTTAVTFQTVHIALSRGAGAIDTLSDRTLTFGGKTDVVIAGGGAVMSDPLAFAVQPRTDLAITIAYGASPAGITGHPGSRTTSYLLTGNVVSRSDAAGAVTTDHWYNINTIEVLTSATSACVAILGNSITDGRGSTTNGQNRWPDVLSEALLRDSSTREVGVINAGIGGNCVLAGGLGPTGVSRFDRDILGQQGLRWIVVFEGVNDIGGVKTANAATTTAANLIAAYQQFVTKARARNIRIYGATIMPFNGNGYFNQYSEQCRSTVNQWIRAAGNFDGCVDFDAVMRNPADTTRLLLPAFQNDGLHPDTAGHRTMGLSVDHALFSATTGTGVGDAMHEQVRRFSLGQNYPNPFNPSTTIAFDVAERSHVSLMVFDSLGRTVCDLVHDVRDPGRYSVRFDAAALASGIYVYRLTAGGYAGSRKMIVVK